MKANKFQVSQNENDFYCINANVSDIDNLTLERNRKDVKPIKLTIVMATYNRVDLLKKNVEHLLKSKYDFELLIINDASSDNTDEIIKKIDDSRITYIRHQLNLGYPKTLNEGISKAKYDNILFCEDDAFILYPNEFLKVVADELRFKTIVGTRRLENGKEIKLNLSKKIKRFFSEPLAREVYGYYGYKRRYIPFCNNCFAFNRSDLKSRFETSEFTGNVFRIESDFHIRARREGAKIVYNPKLVIDHRRYKKGGLRVRDRDDFLYQCMVNHMKYLIRNYSKVNLFFYIFFSIMVHPNKLRLIKKAMHLIFDFSQVEKNSRGLK